MPLNPTGKVATTGWGTVAGVGYNFSKRHAFIGEFMWTRIFPVNGSLQPLQAFSPTGSLTGSTDIYSVTGNYRFELRGAVFGVYLIGGGGWYLRHTNFSEQITVGNGTACTSTWLWWGFNCTSGIVNSGQTLSSSTSNVLGGNAGGGFTIRVGEAPYRLYTEARYHYAPTKSISTQFITVTIGIRY